MEEFVFYAMNVNDVDDAKPVRWRWKHWGYPNQ